MARCSFCGNILERGTGLIYVKKDGTIFHFCSRKCEKNLLKLGRKPRTTNWTVEFQKVKQEGKSDKKESKQEKEKPVKAKKEKPKKSEDQ